MNIVILLVVVIFVYKLLFSNFGLMSDEEKRKQNDIANDFIKNVTNTGFNDTSKNEKKVVIFGNIEEYNKIYKNYINRVNKQKDPAKKVDFDETKFIKSAEKAIGMIMDAFSEKRLDVLEKMLVKELFQIFKNKIENSNDLIYKVVVISVIDKSIESKIINKKNKTVALKVTMEQINYIENTQGELISGSKDKVIKITELWTFVQGRIKDSQEYIWLLKSINNV